MSWIAVLALAGIANGQPVFTNGGFEKGLSGWTIQGRFLASFTAPPQGGLKAHTGEGFAYCNVGPQIGLVPNASSISQAITLPPTPAYTMSFWSVVTTKELPTAPVRSTLAIEIVSDKGVLLETAMTISNHDSGTTWTRRSISFAAYAGKRITLRFRGQSGSATSTIFELDDVALDPILGPTNLTGTVTDASKGTPIAGAVVTTSSGASATTITAGTYLLQNITCKNDTLHITAPGYQSSDVSYSPVCGITNQVNASLTLLPTSLSVSVNDAETGALLAGISVNFDGVTHLTSNAGVALFPSITCHTAPLVISANGFQSTQRNYPPSCAQPNAVSIGLRPEKTAIFVTVADAKYGGAPTDVTVTFGGIKALRLNATVFAITAFACAPGTLTVAAPGYAPFRQDVTPDCGKTALFDLVLDPLPTTISGHVTNAFSGDIVTQGTVTLGRISIPIRSDGGFDVASGCGPAPFLVQAPGFRNSRRDFNPKCGAANTFDLSIPPLPQGTSVYGRVTDENAQPIVGATVTAGGRMSGPTNTLGEYSVEALASCGQGLDAVATAAKFRGSRQPVNIACSAPTEVNFSLVDTQISGTVTDAAGDTIVGATLSLDGKASAVSADGGRYTFHGICNPGTLTVQKDGFKAFSTQIAPTCDQLPFPTVNVTLQPSAANVFLKLTDPQNLDGKRNITEAVVSWGTLPAVADNNGGYGWTNVLCQTAPFTIFSRRYGTVRMNAPANCDSYASYDVPLKAQLTSITAHVRETAGASVAQATVTWNTAAGQPLSSLTDGAGKVLIRNTPCGVGTITITKTGYKPSATPFQALCDRELNFINELFVDR